MSPDPNIFCNVPWAKVHIMSTGTYSPCCVMQKEAFHQNIDHLGPLEWFHSDETNRIRERMLQSKALPECEKCYYREEIGYESGRIRDNYKSMVFPGDNFQRSFKQSPWYDHFLYSHQNHGATTLQPVDYMISLGNECNLACKMCPPIFSSKVSSRYHAWNILPDNLNVRNNWSSDDHRWQKFMDAIDQTPELVRLTFIGGEPLINKRFHQVIARLIDQGRTQCSLHFVTNATHYDPSLVQQLQQFQDCTIEFSLETIDDSNHYIRQGSNTKQVMSNILAFQRALQDNSHFAISSAPQALSINSYHQLIRWALEHNLPIQGHVVSDPAYLHVSVLPTSVRQRLIPRYQNLLQDLQDRTPQERSLAFGIDPSRIKSVLRNETQAMITLLQSPEPANAQDLRRQMIDWMIKWDREFDLDARLFYAEYADWLSEMGYDV